MKLESPKTRFQKTIHAKVHADYVLSAAALEAFDAALLQMQWDMGTATDGLQASAMHYRMDGARRVRDIFLTLADPTTTTAPRRGDNLPNPNA